MAKYDEYSQIEPDGDVGSLWGDDFSQLHEEVSANDAADGDYIVVKDEFAQVADRRHSSQQVSPKAELARALREIAKGESSTRQKSASASTSTSLKASAEPSIGGSVVKGAAKKLPVVKEDQLALKLQGVATSCSAENDPFGLGDVDLIDLSKLRRVENVAMTSPELTNSEMPAADAARVGAASETTAQAPSVDAAGVGAANEATAQAPSVDAAGMGAADEATAQASSADTAEVGAASEAATQVAEGEDNGADSAVTAPVKRKRKVRVQPNNCKRRYDREAKRIRLDKIKDCVLTHFAQKQFCIQDIKDILKLEIEQWEKDGVRGFDTELSVCVKGMGIEVVGQVQRMNGRRGRPSNIMVLTGKAE